MARKSQQLRIVMTRMPDHLRSRIQREAKLNSRSMNAEIIYRLQESFQREDQTELAKLAVQVATSTLQEKGLLVVPFGASGHAQKGDKS